MKRLAAALAPLILLAVLVSCGSAALPELTARQIADEFDKHIASVNDLGEPGDDYLSAVVGIDASEVAGYVLKLQIAGTGADSYGVFVAKDEAGKENVRAALTKYISDIQTNYSNFNYLPEEESKIMNAEIWSEGQYVYFVILGDSERNSVNEAFKQLMK